jgi:hypothetical protein
MTSRSFKFGNITTASYQLAFILDPVSEQAARWSPLISVCDTPFHGYLIGQIFDCVVALNPRLCLLGSAPESCSFAIRGI